MQSYVYKGYELHLWGNFWFITPPGVPLSNSENVIDWGNARDGQPERDARSLIDALNILDENDGAATNG